MAIQAVIAGALRLARVEHGQLALQADRRTGYQRLARCHAGGIHRLAGGEIVGAVQHQIHRCHGGSQRVGIQALRIPLHLQLRIDRQQAAGRRVDLALTDAGRVMHDLPLQVGDIHRIEIRQVQLAHPSCRQVQRHWRTQTAQPDDQCTAAFQAQLPLDIHLRQQDLPAVAQQLVVRQHCFTHVCYTPG